MELPSLVAYKEIYRFYNIVLFKAMGVRTFEEMQKKYVTKAQWHHFIDEYIDTRTKFNIRNQLQLKSARNNNY